MNKRVALKSGTSIHSGNGKGFDYIIKDVIGTGANGIVYSSTYTDNFGFAHKVIIKECYPYKSDIERVGDCLKWSSTEEEKDDKTRFNETYNKLTTVSGNENLVNETSKSIDCINYNNTIYSITVYDNAATFADTDYHSIIEILKTVRLLAHTVGKYHNSGLLHLDIKPDNFLVYPKPSEHIVLFDLDTITDINDISNGRIETVSCSEGWAAPEQMRGLVSKLCPATDIFSIGAVLFEKIMGRRVCCTDTSIFAGWEYDDDRFNIRNVNPAIKRQLTNIFKKCLSANIKKRYQNTDDLIKDLDEAINLLAPGKPYIISEIEDSINFIGREAELSEIDFAFSKGSKAVFLTGMGGIGKTEIAKSYANIHLNDYDAIVYKRYNGSLKEILNDISLQNCNCDKNDRNYESYVRDSLNERILLVIDNFDVEYDEYLMRVLSLNCKLLFTSRINRQEELNDSKYCFISINEMPRSDQMSVFIQNCQSSLTESDKGIIEKILDTINGYTLLIPLIAKQISKGLETLSELADNLKDAGIRGAAHGKVRHLKDGTQLAGNIYEILRKVLKIGETDEKEKYVLCSLCLLNGIKINCKTFEKTIGREYSDAIDDLIHSSVISISCDAEKYLSLHMILIAVYKEEYQPHFTEFPWVMDIFNTVYKQYDSNCKYLSREINNYDNLKAYEKILRLKANFNVLYTIIKNSVFNKESIKKLLNTIRKTYKQSNIYAVGCGCADVKIIDRLTSNAAFEELSGNGKSIVYLLCFSIMCTDFCFIDKKPYMIWNQVVELFENCFKSMVKYIKLFYDRFNSLSEDHKVLRIKELIDDALLINNNSLSLKNFSDFYSQKSIDNIESIKAKCNSFYSNYSRCMGSLLKHIESDYIFEKLSTEYRNKLSDLKANIFSFRCDIDSSKDEYESFGFEYSGNDATDDVIDALLYFWGDIFTEDIDDNVFITEIDKIVSPEKWEHYYSISDCEEDDVDIVDIISNGEDAYFDLKESLEEDNNSYYISAYDFGKVDDEDDKMVSYIENMQYKYDDMESAEEYHNYVHFEHIEAINDNYEFEPDSWFQGMNEFLRYGLTCLGFQCDENLDLSKTSTNLKKAVYIKNILLSMHCYDSYTLESCIIVDRFEGASIEEGKRIIECYAKEANYFLDDVILLANIVEDWNEELFHLYVNRFIERLKKEETNIRIVRLLNSFASLINDTETLNLCVDLEKQLLKPPDSIIFNKI